MTEYTKRVVFGWMSSLVLLLAGCAESQVEEPRPDEPAGPVTVRVAAARDITRTEIEENGTVTRWSDDDRIALWASDGAALALEAQPFALWHFGEVYPEAWFTAQIDPMTEGRYTYYGAYPVPDAVSGTVAEYDLPAVQDGSKSMRRAVMVARPVEGEALTGAANGELHLSFVHKLHILKITIPEEKNLFGQPIDRLELDFGRPVTGRLTVDVSDPDAPVTLSEGASVLSLDFPTPVDAGSSVFAVIAPVDLTEGAVAFRAYSRGCESESISMPGKRFLAGHTTPIRLTIPCMRKVTYIDFSIGQGELNHLGEEPQSFTVRMLDGGTFPGGETELTFAADASNRYEYSFEGEYADNLSGKRFEVVFDSEHAVVRSEFRMPDVQAYGRNTLPALEVPYLFFEDFSGVNQEFHYNDKHSFSNTGDKGRWLDEYGLTGWSGGRVGGMAGTSVRIACHREFLANSYYARMDSAPIECLKPGVTAPVRITFDYGMNREGSGLGTADVGQTCYMGYVTGAEAYTSASTTGTWISDFYIKELVADWNTLGHTTEYSIADCTNNTRLSWRTACESNNGPNNSTCFLYIDNVRVSIEK